MYLVHDEKVSVYYLGWWRWHEMRMYLEELDMQYVETPGLLRRTFVVISDMATIKHLNNLLGIANVMPIDRLRSLLALALCLMTVPSFAGT